MDRLLGSLANLGRTPRFRPHHERDELFVAVVFDLKDGWPILCYFDDIGRRLTLAGKVGRLAVGIWWILLFVTAVLITRAVFAGHTACEPYQTSCRGCEIRSSLHTRATGCRRLSVSP